MLTVYAFNSRCRFKPKPHLAICGFTILAK